jgi:histidyl-tRNA synthetase
MASVHPPSGFRDFINNDARRRLHLMNLISGVYQQFGFRPLDTPVLENLDVLLGGGGGEENEKLIFKILKRGGKLQEALQSQNEDQIAEFGLRFDMTVPLSRVVALHRNQIHFPWKVFHIGPVWRADRPQKGRFREFIQCDVDIVGAKGVGAEIEVIQATVNAIHAAGASGFELRINDRRLLQAMGEYFGFQGERLAEFAILLDKKDKLELPELVSSLKELAGQDLPTELLQMVEGQLPLESVQKFHPGAYQDLKTIISTVQELNLPLSRVVFDPSLVRGMGYYTGPVFELRHSSAGYSFGGGGRYDRLIGRLSGQEIPACGFSIGFERLALLLEENESQSKPDSSIVFIPVFEESLRPKVCQLARALRDEGVSVDVYPDQAKIKNQFKFASEEGYRWVVIVGESEWNSQMLKIKDFKTGTETEVPRDQLVTALEERLSQSKNS